MNIHKERRKIDAVLNNYRAQLDSIPDELFNISPPGGGWSYAEVYSHILQATIAASMGLERCTHVVPSSKKGDVNLLGRLVLLFGRFPPVKITAPDIVNAKMPAVNISKEEARNLIVKCRKRIDTVIEYVEKAPQNARVKHPRLGMLNAQQWFKFMRIHLAHHLNQLNRITIKLKAD